MLRKYLHQVKTCYPRNTVNIVQKSEYSACRYLNSYHKSRNFFLTSGRSKFVLTPKSLLLLIITWFLYLSSLSFLIYLIITSSLQIRLISFFFLLASPYILPYLIIPPLFIINIIIQRPVEYFIISKARQKLKNHKAVKIAVAGSFGKTTMREILKTVLSEGKKVAAPLENYNTLLGISRFVKDLKGDEDVLIFELGEYYSGDIKKLCNLTNPDVGIITGINEAHLERFKKVEKTAKTIFELADYLEGKSIYVNGESKIAKANSRKFDMLYSCNGVNKIKITSQRSGLDGTFFTLSKDNVTLKLETALLGLHQVGPIAVAVDIALALKMSLDQISKGVKNTKPFKNRLELRNNKEGIFVIDDTYNGNPDGARVAIEFLSSIKDQRRFYVTPGLLEMGKKKEEVHLEIGKKLASAKIEKVILIKNTATPYIEEGLKKEKYGGEIIWFNDVLSVFSALDYLTVDGDVILFQNDWPDYYK